MKEIKDLMGIVRIDKDDNEYPLEFPRLKQLDGGTSVMRTPLIFLVDGSTTMRKYIEDVNRSLRYMHDLFKKKNCGLSLDQVVDLAVIVFSRLGEGPGVSYQRGFDLPGDIPFTLSTCRGSTPLGEAMLHAYIYARLRKEQYKKNHFLYSQPIIILLSDLQENSSAKYRIDGQEYERGQLFEAMAELYVEQMKGTRKQYTFVIPLGEVSEDRKATLEGVDFRSSASGAISSVLDSVIEEYVASVSQPLEGKGFKPKTAEGADIFIGHGLNPKKPNLDEFIQYGKEEPPDESMKAFMDYLCEGRLIEVGVNEESEYY